MKIPLDEITSVALQIHFEGTEDVLSSAIQTMHVPSDTSISPFVTGQVSLEKQGDLLLIDGQVTASVTLHCSRCLKVFQSERMIDLRFSARNLSGEQGSPEMTLLDTQPDEIMLLENELNLGELIVQEILLDLPLQPLCRGDCPGLCPRCGRLKGSKECRCEEEKTIDPRWQKLISLKGK